MTRPRLTLQAILILLKYRALTVYRDPVYLGPRIGDKLVFSLIVLTLYLGEGGEMAPAKVRSLEQSLAVSGPLGGSRERLQRRLHFGEMAARPLSTQSRR